MSNRARRSRRGRRRRGLHPRSAGRCGCGRYSPRRVRRPAVEERLQRPAVMGIVSVTPDSFSDGGDRLDPEVAAVAAREMIAAGASIVDIGGESTRPGSEGVALDEELRRVVPVLERLEGVAVSIDTAKSEVARRALAL